MSRGDGRFRDDRAGTGSAGAPENGVGVGAEGEAEGRLDGEVEPVERRVEATEQLDGRNTTARPSRPPATAHAAMRTVRAPAPLDAAATSPAAASSGAAILHTAGFGGSSPARTVGTATPALVNRWPARHRRLRIVAPPGPA